MSNDAQQRPPQCHRIGVGVEETRHQSLARRTQCAAHNLHFKNALYTGVGTTSEGRAFTVPGHQIKSHDDVSSGPRPKAHWYMLTHYCCNDTAPLQDPASCCTAFQSQFHTYTSASVTKYKT